MAISDRELDRVIWESRSQLGFKIRVVVIVCKEIALEGPRGRMNSAGAQCRRGPRTEPWDANTEGVGRRGGAGET